MAAVSSHRCRYRRVEYRQQRPRLAGGTLRAGGQIRVNGELVEEVGQTSFAFGGGFVGLGASVSVITDKSTNHAFIADGAVVDNAAAINILASTNQSFDIDTDGATVGAVAVGASFSKVAVGNDNATDTYAGIAPTPASAKAAAASAPSRYRPRRGYTSPRILSQCRAAWSA